MKKFKININQKKTNLYFLKMLARYQCEDSAVDELNRFERVLSGLVGFYDQSELDEIYNEDTFKYLDILEIDDYVSPTHWMPLPPLPHDDDFYNQYNQARLQKTIAKLKAGEPLIYKSMDELEAMERN